MNATDDRPESLFDALSDRYGAMTTKEMRQGLRRGVFVVPFILIQFLAVLAMAYEFSQSELETYSPYIGVMNPSLFFISGPFWMVVFVICALVMPMGGMTVMAQEMDDENYELLLMTSLSRWMVVRGKFWALWGLCLLTLASLLPYMLMRYFIGGVDVWRSLLMVLSVVFCSAMMCAAAIGSSSYRALKSQLLVFLLFVLSIIASGYAALFLSALRTGSSGVIYHINALCLILAYCLLGLILARSRIRLVQHAYEVSPSALMLGILLFTPLLTLLVSAVTGGYAGGIGLLAMGGIAWFNDVSPKAPSWVVQQSHRPRSTSRGIRKALTKSDPS